MFETKCQDAREAVQYIEGKIAEEKAKEPWIKYMKDHQDILRRKNRVDTPIPPDHDQEAWFAKLESNEIWEMVCEYLTNPLDMTSAYFSCEMFRKHLEQRRKMELFPKVLEVFRDTGRLQYFGFGENAPEDKEEESREVLKLRLVSKALKKSVDEVFLTPLKISPSRPIWHRDSWKWESPSVCRFTSIRDVEWAFEKLENPKSCASLITALEVDDRECSNGDRDIFYVKVAQFLDVFGEAVWGLRFYQKRLQGLQLYNYNALLLVVSRLPQLKALFLHDSWTEHEYLGFTLAQLRNMSAQIKLLIRQNPFPTISTLELCDFVGFPEWNEFLVVEILTKNSQVKGFAYCGKWDTDNTHRVVDHDGNVEFDEITFMYMPGQIKSVIPNIVWNELGNLHLEYFNFGYSANSRQFMIHFQLLEDFNWPLKWLAGSLENDDLFDDVDHRPCNIVSVLNRFSDSLEEFEFRISTRDMGSCLKNNGKRAGIVVKNFRKLKKFEFPEVKGPLTTLKRDREHI